MPLFVAGDIIDGKYEVKSLCSDAGGMGTVLFVRPLKQKLGFEIVLKYCKGDDEEHLKRFRREVRLLGTFKGNTRVVQIVDQDLDHDPPYFVMRHYPDGDLSTRAASLRGDYGAQESCFLQMIDCVQELHARNEFHRDIKPQNFLLDGDKIAVSDFGLTTELGSHTAFTRSSAWWGTQGYIPPEFLSGGFKNADAAGDIFMLGKTFYVLLTGRDATYLVADDVPPPLFHVISRCCNVSKSLRYQTLSQLKQSLVAAYDVVLARSGGFGRVKQLISVIEERLEQESKYSSSQVAGFVEQLAVLDEDDQVSICKELSIRFFWVIGQEPLNGALPGFLTIYGRLVQGNAYGFEYAETIASNMRQVFRGSGAPVGECARALGLAIHAAVYQNRYAAMDTCRSMITSVDDEVLGFHVAPVLLANRGAFVADIEPSECRSDAVRNALRQIRET
jgi:serine/threonine protein kinase